MPGYRTLCDYGCKLDLGKLVGGVSRLIVAILKLDPAESSSQSGFVAGTAGFDEGWKLMSHVMQYVVFTYTVAVPRFFVSFQQLAVP